MNSDSNRWHAHAKYLLIVHRAWRPVARYFVHNHRGKGRIIFRLAAIHRTLLLVAPRSRDPSVKHIVDAARTSLPASYIARSSEGKPKPFRTFDQGQDARRVSRRISRDVRKPRERGWDILAEDGSARLSDAPKIDGETILHLLLSLSHPFCLVFVFTYVCKRAARHAAAATVVRFPSPSISSAIAIAPAECNERQRRGRGAHEARTRTHGWRRGDSFTSRFAPVAA